MGAEYIDTRDISLAELTKFPGNARRGDLPKIRDSLKANGQYRALVVRDTGTALVILAGNHTRDALAEEGHERARCEVIRCDDQTANRINLADNRTGEIGGYDDEALALLLAPFEVDPVGTGWTDSELYALLHPDADEDDEGIGRPDPDENVDPPEVPHSRPGDLWLLGPHRLLCGDAMKRENYTTLLQGERPDVLVTDPPYGVALGNDKGKNAISGDLTQAAIPIAFAVSLEHLTDDARVYLFGGSNNWGMYNGLFDHHLRMQVRPIVWVKEGFILRQNGYHSQFEMVYFGWKGKGGGPNFWFGDRKGSDVWQVSRDSQAERDHPTQKPVEVCSIPIRNSCPPGGLVLEPFAGSGSTLIAAHREGRRCRAIELDARFVDVVCRRYQAASGELPALAQPDGTSTPHDFLADDFDLDDDGSGLGGFAPRTDDLATTDA